MTDTVLLAGATGMLGGRIATHLLDPPGVELRLLVRPGSARRPEVDRLVAAGARVAEGDLRDPASLRAAATGVDVVVSAVQGGRDVVVDGQVALARAAVAAGARRILPSDYALDVFKATPGEVLSYDLRREAGERIAELPIERVHVLNGAFLDMFAHPQGALELDDERGTATFWGTGEERFEATTVDDTARYAALAALDRELPSGKLAVAGDRPSFGGMVTEFERLTGRRYERVSRGPVAELEALTARARAEDPASPAAIIGGYQVCMLTGRTALEDLANDRYPQVTPTTFADLLRAGRLTASRGAGTPGTA